MPPQTRKYRLEIAVKRLHGLVNMSSSAKIVFTVRFSNFPEIFIRPQTSGGGGVVERSPAGDRIYSLTYNVCHKAEFRLSDDEYRKMSSSQCVCCVFDEGQRQSQMSWTVACPFTSGQAEGRQHANYPMLDAAGRTMGFAEMLCRVVPVDWAVAPASTATTMTAATGVPPGPVTSGEMPPPMSPAHVSINGKPYVIRVVVNDKAAKKKKNKTHSKPPDGQHDCSVASGALVVVGGGGGSTSSGNKVENKSRGCQLKNTDGNDKRRAMSTAKKKTLLHVLQYDVTCQIQSNCVNLYATLIREFTSLNGAVLNEMTKPMTDKVDSVVQRILKFANIVLHVANDLVEASGNEYTSSPAEDNARKNPVNKLPIPREGSVAHYLMYQVLFQLQCLGTNFCHITTMYRQPLEVRLSTLHHQHAKFIRKLSAEVQELTKCINIIVQSTIDKDCNGKDAFSGPSSASYSTSFTNSSSNSSSSSPLLSSRGSTRRKSSTVESVLSVSTSEDKEVIKPTSALTPSIISTVPQSNAGFQISPAASTQNYSVTSPLPSSMPAQAGQNKPTFSPGYTFPVLPESEKKPLPSAAHFTPPVLDTATVGRPSITSSVFSGLQPLSPAPLSHISVTSGPTAFATEGDTQQQQRQPSLGSGPVPMPVPQATSTASPGTSEMVPSMRQPSLGSGPVPMPVPQATSTASPGTSEMVPSMRQPSLGSGPVPMPVPQATSTASPGTSEMVPSMRQPSLGSGPVPMPVPQATSTASPGTSEMVPSMRQPSLGSGPVPMPVPQATSTASPGTSEMVPSMRQPSLGSGPVPMPVPQATSTASPGASEMVPSMRQPSLGSGPVPMPVPQATSTASPGTSEMVPSMRQPSLGSGPVPMPVPLTPGMPR